MFRGFGVPSFQVLEVQWIKTAKRQTFQAFAFHRYYWFVLKLFPVRIIPQNCGLKSGSAHVELPEFFTTADSASHTVMGFPPRSQRSVVYNCSTVHSSAFCLAGSAFAPDFLAMSLPLWQDLKNNSAFGFSEFFYVRHDGLNEYLEPSFSCLGFLCGVVDIWWSLRFPSVQLIYKNTFYCATQICIADTCYGDVAGWVAGWVSVRHTPALYQNGKTYPKTFSTIRYSPIILASSDPCADTQFQGNPFSGGVINTGDWKIGDFRASFDGNRRLSRKRCEIGRWLLWNVNRKSWMPD